MRISDWISDVCSSDLPVRRRGAEPRRECREPGDVGEEDRDLASLAVGRRGTLAGGLGTDRGRLVEAGDRGQQSLAVAERGDAEAAQVLVRQVAKQVRPDTVLCKGGRVFLEAERFERSEEHTSELQSLMRISYAVFCSKKKTTVNKSSTGHNRLL